MKQYKVVVTGVLALMSITSVFASFESDYQKFINQLIASSPVAGHNAFSGVVALDVVMKDGGNAHGDIFINGVVQTGSNTLLQGNMGTSVRVSKDIFPLALTGDATLNAVMGIIVSGTTGSAGTGYITLKQFDTNITMLLQTGTKASVDKFKSNWFVLPQSDTNSTPVSSVGSSIMKRAQVYQAIIKYPIVSPFGKQGTNPGIYNVRLNKSNISRLALRIAQIDDSSLTSTGVTQIQKEVSDALKTVSSRGVFNSQKQNMLLAVMDTKSKSSMTIGLTTGSMISTIVSKQGGKDEIAKITANRDHDSMIGSVSTTVDDMTISVNASLKTYRDNTTKITIPSSYLPFDTLTQDN